MKKLIDFYMKNYKSKIFYKEMISSTHNYGILYVYDYIYEIQNFKDTFGAYFPYYIKNEDQLNSLDVTNENFENRLKEISIRNWARTSIIPQRDTDSSGIYGELFLDFYLRVVCGLDPLISYASKRSFRSNQESTGIDNVVFDVQENIEIYLAEAKFVFSKSSAKSSLLGDIKGTKSSESHITPEYINSYMDFVIIQASDSNQLKNERMKKFIDEANTKFDEGVNFLQVCIDNKVKFHVVLFAIFSEIAKDVNKFDAIYNDLSKELEKKLSALGVYSYDYKIVFIPTNNTSMKIKEGINAYYE